VRPGIAGDYPARFQNSRLEVAVAVDLRRDPLEPRPGIAELLRRRSGAARDLGPVEAGLRQERDAEGELDLPLRILQEREV
jgi:hypothetical protein